MTADARERHLASLAGREAAAWSGVGKLIATKQPKGYDEAVALLRNHREACARAGRQVEAATRIARPWDVHARKSSLLERLRKAQLMPVHAATLPAALLEGKRAGKDDPEEGG